MNCKRFAICTLIGFAFIFIFDFIVHGILLAPMYAETANLWRTLEEMENFRNYALLSQLALTVVLAFIFTRHFEGKGIKEGIRFGSMLGVLMGIGAFGMYPYMPIPMELALAWFVSSFVEITLLGVIFSLIYKNK